MQNRGASLIQQEEGPHVGEIPRRETAAELLRQLARERRDHLFAIRGPALAPLLLLDDTAADFKVGVDLDHVYTPCDGGMGRANQSADVLEKR